jgi:large subunit ribosomal protein L17
MRHGKKNYHFNRDANSRKALFLNLAKSLIEKEQIKTTLQRAKALRGVVEKLITRAKEDSVPNRRLVASELENDAKTVKKLFAVLGPRYVKRPGGYTRVLKSGFRYGDAAEMAIMELVDRDVDAKKSAAPEGAKKSAAKKESVKDAGVRDASKKVAHDAGGAAVRASKGVKEVSVKRRATGK